jgi:magnesium chelatase family protein
MAMTGDEDSATVRKRVIAARRLAEQRLGAGRCNADLGPGESVRVEVTPGAREILRDHYRRLGLSGRGHDRVIRVARTIADLAGRAKIDEDSMKGALALRRPV